MSTEFGRQDCYTNYCWADANRDGAVSGPDIGLLSVEFGRHDCEVCGNSVCIDGEDKINCPDDCFDISLSISTLKNEYEIGEQINLTDPPEEVVEKILKSMEYWSN